MNTPEVWVPRHRCGKPEGDVQSLPRRYSESCQVVDTAVVAAAASDAAAAAAAAAATRRLNHATCYCCLLLRPSIPTSAATTANGNKP